MFPRLMPSGLTSGQLIIIIIIMVIFNNNINNGNI